MTRCFKEQFIQEYKRGLFKRKLLSLFYYLSLLIPKNNKLIVAYVDYEKINEQLVPYKNDNVYLLCQYIQNQKNNLEIFYIPANQFGSKLNRGFTRAEKIKHFWLRLRARIILTKMPIHSSDAFTKAQHQIALGYFIPFKSDYWDIQKCWVFYGHILKQNCHPKEANRYRTEILEHFTYKEGQFDKTNLTYITPSQYASNTIATSHNLSVSSFKVLGSPKSDYVPEGKPVDFKQIFNLDFTPQVMVLYTPTFRDKFIRKSWGEVEKSEQTVFGYNNEKEAIEKLLAENNILLIIKLHKSFPFYREMEEALMQKNKSYFKNCYFLDFETEAKHDISVHDLFAQSDAMIVDYSSISFDYLPYDKPIIFNTPDIEEYRGYRGFSYEPIEEMMPGDQVKSIEEFKEALLRVVDEEDRHSQDRKRVLSMVNEVPQGKSLKNISEYVMRILD